MYELVDEIRIAADPMRIYDALVDLMSYPKWNPFNVAASGPPSVGGPLIEVVGRIGKRTMRVKHKILVMAPGEVFQWGDTGWFTNLVYGQTTRYLERQSDGTTRYRVVLQLTGPMVFMARWLFERDINAALRAESVALKQLTES